MSLRAWVIGARPQTLQAAVAPVLVGTAMAHWQGVDRFLPALAALVAALLIQIGTNLANDYFDFRKGTDTEARVGPTRVVQSGMLAPGAVLRGTVVVLAAATLVGIYLVAVGGVPILLVGLAAVACAILYTGGPFPLAYHGLGDPFAFVFFGPVAVAGTYWVQALAFRPDLLLAGAGVGALITAILVVNNLRDREQDAASGKRTLAVSLGVRGSRAEFVALVAAAMAVPLLGWTYLGWPPWTLLALGSAALLAGPTRRVLGWRDPRELNPALGGTARGVAWYAGLLAVGFLAG